MHSFYTIRKMKSPIRLINLHFHLPAMWTVDYLSVVNARIEKIAIASTWSNWTVKGLACETENQY